MTKHLVPLFALTTALVALGGCAKTVQPPPTATVTGKITLPGGKPLTGGRIYFHSVATPGSNVGGEIEADGSYKATPVPPGECKVTIENLYLKSVPANPTSADVKPDPSLKYVHIDAKYSSLDTSGLDTKVAVPTHTYDVELK